MFWAFLFSISFISGNSNRDFYSILSLKHDCSERDIDRVYMRLSKQYHPDKNKNDPKAADRFNEINDAYRTLKDPLKRRVYDLYGEPGVSLYDAPKSEYDPSVAITHSEHPDSSSAQIRKKGKTYRIFYPVDLMDFYTGNSFKLHITRKIMCRCPHAGFYCQKCHGRPTVNENATLYLVVERGSDENVVVTFNNAGDQCEANGPGDIEVEIVSRPHQFFTRHGTDLHMDIALTLRESLLGFKRTYKHLDGSDLIIESKDPLACGKTLNITGKGMPLYMYPGEYGNLIVHTHLKWPKQLSDESRKRIADSLSS